MIRTARAEALARYETLLSPYTGVVSEAWQECYPPDDDRAFFVGASFKAPFPAGTHRNQSVGTGYTADGARVAALGEAIERYAASCPPDRTISATARELGPVAVDPDRFALHSKAQYQQDDFPCTPFTKDTKTRWVQGYSLPSKQPALVPAQVAYLDFGLQPEAKINLGVTTGMACAVTEPEAVLSGLLESIERDAFMVTWTNLLSLPIVDWSGDPEIVRLHERYLVPAGVRCRVLDLSQLFETPTMLACVRGGRDDVARLSLGAASALTAREAWVKATREAFQIRRWVKRLVRDSPARRYRDDFEDVLSFEDHALLYQDEEMASATSFLDESPHRRDIRDIAPVDGETADQAIEKLMSRLEARNASAYAVNITPDDVTAAGLNVVAVVTPELVGIDFSHPHRCLGGDRLCTAAYRAGISEAPLNPDQLNQCPHPFT